MHRGRSRVRLAGTVSIWFLAPRLMLARFLCSTVDNDRSSAFASLAPMLPQTTATPHDAPKRPGIYASAALTSTSPICVVY